MKIITIITKLTASLLLFLAIFNLPYGYYTFLRIIIFLIAGWCLFDEYNTIGKLTLVWRIIFVLIALIFNPVLPIYLSKDVWQIIDIICSILFLVSAVFKREDIKVNVKVENEKN